MKFDFDAWIRQPTTIHGLGVAAAGLGAALAHVTFGSPTLDLGVAAVAYVCTHLGIDDHSATEVDVQALATDAAAAALNHGAGADRVLIDAAELAAELRKPAPAAPPAPAKAPAAA